MLGNSQNSYQKPAWMLSKDPSVKSMEDWSEQFVWLKVDGGRWNKLNKTCANFKNTYIQKIVEAIFTARNNHLLISKPN